MIGKAIKALQAIGNLEIVDIHMDNNSDSYHKVKSKYREEVIVPYIAISQNASFFTSKGEHYVTTADGVICHVKEWKERNICDLEDEVMRLYNVTAWEFLSKWHKYEAGMSSLFFIYMKLEKYEPKKECLSE